MEPCPDGELRRIDGDSSRISYWCVASDVPDFDPVWFDERALASRSLLIGKPGAGRGNACYFRWRGGERVLRHYRRGGLVSKLSRRHYVYTGMDNTRAVAELTMLHRLQGLSLPAPRPVACRVERQGLLYTASLVTERLPGATMAECMQSASLDEAHWIELGAVIAHFHRHGVYHADLNIHNLLIAQPQQPAAACAGRVFLLDFDRARFRPIPRAPAQSGWCLQNIRRLRRSIEKTRVAMGDGLSADSGSASDSHSAANVIAQDGFDVLFDAWCAAMGNAA